MEARLSVTKWYIFGKKDEETYFPCYNMSKLFICTILWVILKENIKSCEYIS